MSITVTRPIHFRSRAHGRKVASTTPSPLATLPVGRVPRVARLMALAIVLDQRLRAGEFKSIGEMARHYSVSQPRMTQILNLTLLAPTLAEGILIGSLDRLADLSEHQLRSVVAETGWEGQRLRLIQLGCRVA